MVRSARTYITQSWCRISVSNCSVSPVLDWPIFGELRLGGQMHANAHVRQSLRALQILPLGRVPGIIIKEAIPESTCTCTRVQSYHQFGVR